MTESTAGALPQVTALDEERRRYEGWIAQLEARRGTTPDHVLQRVRSDYEARLRDVVEQLGQHAELLRATVADRAQELATLRDAERQREDARAEAELRAAVGEYTQDQWRELSGRTEAELAELAARRAHAEAELERLEQVLALATQRSDPQERRAAGEQPRVAGERERITEPSAGGTPAYASQSGAAPRGPEFADGPAAAPVDDWDGLPDAPRGSTGGPPPSGERDLRSSAGWDDPTEPVTPVRPPASAGSAASVRPGAFAEAPPGRGAAADPDTPQAKTLRCHECGTMNYPTEWYCERCGGELAAL